jgi:hypothetical protein
MPGAQISILFASGNRIVSEVVGSTWTVLNQYQEKIAHAM